MIYRLLLIIAILLLTLFVGLPHLIFHFIFYRPKRSTKVPKAYVNTPHYKAAASGLALLRSLPCEEVTITSRDGLKLHGWLWKAEKESSRWMLGIHGYKSYSRPEFGCFFEFYRNLGFNILLPDDRAHGPSEGTYIGFGVPDRLDCIDWAKYLVNRFGTEISILLHGVSMGSATVLAASGEADLPVQVKGITADCGYTSADAILTYQLKNAFHIPVKPFLPLCERICRRKAGFGFHEYTPVTQVAKAKVPIFFVHGCRDQMVPVSMVHELYDACASEKRLLLVEEAAHAESIYYNRNEYEQIMRDFFRL